MWQIILKERYIYIYIYVYIFYIIPWLWNCSHVWNLFPQAIEALRAISQTIFHRNSNPMANWFQCNFIVGHHITTKFCTCHDSTAVMPYAKFHSDQFPTTWMRAEWHFHRICITMEKWLLNWAPRLFYKANTVGCHCNAFHYYDLTYNAAMIAAEHKSDFELTKDIPYLTLAGELWGVWCEDWCYNGITFYHDF